MANPKPVLISGAGLSGLLLARSLRYNKLPLLIYERDASIAARAQGYRIRISEDGQNALKEVLPAEEYARLWDGTSKTGGGGMHAVDAVTGERKEKPPGEAGAAAAGPSLGPAVLGTSRRFLRQRLLEGETDVVHWGKQALGYTLTDDGVTLDFVDGTKSPEGSLLIAADGPQSAVSKQLTDGKARAYDTGARMIHGETPARAFSGLGEGVWRLQDESNASGTLGLITNVRPGTLEGDGDTSLGWNFVGGPGTFDAPNGDFSIVGKVAADLSRELTSHWHSTIRPIFEQQIDGDAAFLKMSTSNPDGVPEWPSNPRVTLMGDAVHCMTPAGGVGANTALRDAAFLGRLLGEAGGYEEGITEKYEKEMRAYASENVKMSFEAAAKLFNITELK